jgi:hypothetical protein
MSLATYTLEDMAAEILALPPGEQALAAAAAAKIYGLANNKTPEQLALEADYQNWLRTLFPQYFSRPFGQHHQKFWDWAWAIIRGVRPRSEVDIWSRGHGKSTNAEAVCAAWGAKGTRRYVWYLCGTQDQADDHVGNVASMLESKNVREFYPQIGERLVNKFGTSKGWKRNRIRTATGYTVDALGLDVAKRGVKLEEQRPDGIIIDDVDGKHDTPQATQKKIEIITHSILPSGSTHELAVLGVQNLIIKDGIFSQLADGRADWLADREVNGPVPALRNFDYEKRGRRYFILSGDPTWDGMDRDACQLLIDTEGIDSFLRERQHKVDLNLPGAIFPEWNERYHVITESEFRGFYGPISWTNPENPLSPYQIPHNWNLGRGLDWGTTAGHPMACIFVGRPYETHPLTSAVFVYREITRPKFPYEDEAAEPVSPRRVKKAILAATKKNMEEKRMEISAMSHEASAAFNTFQDMMDEGDTLWFNKWKAEVGSGVPQIQNALEIDETKDHPFRRYPANFPDRTLRGKPLKGCPNFFVIVPDDQGELYCDGEGELKVRGAVDSAGMARLRYEFPKYRNPVTPTGQEKVKPNPKAHGEDDAIDALKGLANKFFPTPSRMSEEERIDALLPEQLRIATIRKRQRQGDQNVQGAIAHRLHAAANIKKKLNRKKSYSPLADYKRRLKEGK